MHQHHQRSLFPAERQGEEGHETAAKHPVLVCINDMYVVVNVHIS
ncbi:FlmC family protein, partial [Klebsiella pneumoniae]|nr:FlmC family protein [Klebsiella pneumoniae]